MHPVLRRGSTGKDVAGLQELLNKHLQPSPNLRIDGIFGPRTESAILRYQAVARLYIDGVVGSGTWTALRNGVTSDQSDQPLPAISAYNAPWMAVALREVGQRELAGDKDNPRILRYHGTTSLHATNDEVPWCSSFVNWCLKQVGIPGTNSAAASSWLHWGKTSVPMSGAISVVRKNTGQNHVGFFVSEGKDFYSVLGGNQSHRVRVSKYPKSSYIFLGHRWPTYDAR